VLLCFIQMESIIDGSLIGDVSMTRQDAAIGDNRNFQVDLYDEVVLSNLSDWTAVLMALSTAARDPWSIWG